LWAVEFLQVLKGEMNMASIKGVQLKNIKSKRGHEGESCLEANIYMDIKGKAKKIGSVEEETWSGEYQITYEQPEYEAMLEKAVTEYFAENPSDVTGNTIFLYELRMLADIEKQFKKLKAEVDKDNTVAKKELYTPILLYIFFPNSETVKDVWRCYNEGQLQKVLKDEKAETYTVYRSLDQFVIA
jgi:hypothetical protein